MPFRMPFYAHSHGKIRSPELHLERLGNGKGVLCTLQNEAKLELLQERRGGVTVLDGGAYRPLTVKRYAPSQQVKCTANRGIKKLPLQPVFSICWANCAIGDLLAALDVQRATGPITATAVAVGTVVPQCIVCWQIVCREQV
eukprot:scaffold415419_cov38-Prasinocladus_malaysianus.AAC.1